MSVEENKNFVSNAATEEFDKFIRLLSFTPHLIPLCENSKEPNVPKTESWKDEKHRLTVEQARQRIYDGGNVGIVATGDDIVIFDLDNPEKYTFPKETLTVKTRSGKLHKYFLNDGSVKNADGKGQYAKCGEVRAEWKYVVCPGSYVPCDTKDGDGVYRVIVEMAPVPLRPEELPIEFQPSITKDTEQKVSPVNMTGSFRNQYGWPLEDIRARDKKLDGLLRNSDAGYASASEADMATLAKLLYWGYMEGEAVDILQYFRGREKLNREDYLRMTLQKIGKTDTIADHVNVKTWSPKPKEKSEKKSGEVLSTSEAVRVWQTEDLNKYVLADLDKRVKHDRPVKLSVLAAGLSAFSKKPINLALKGETSVGKTYNTIQCLKYFPQETVWYMGGMSPKSLIHSYGVLMNRAGKEIVYDETLTKPFRKGKTEDEYKKESATYEDKLKKQREELKGSYTLVDLSHKILVFLEAPDFQTFQMLLPILSHDKEEIAYMFVDKTGQGKLQTKKVILKGWPATVFLTTKTKYMEEFNTRAFSATPENTSEKIKDANELTNMKASLPWKYQTKTPEFEIIESLILNLQDKFNEEEVDVIPPFLNLYELFPKDQPRDMRDFQHFTQFLATVTMLNYYQRLYMKDGKARYVLATLEDVKQALTVYHEIFETTRTGAEKRLLDFYHNTVKTRKLTDDKGEPLLDEKRNPRVEKDPQWYLRQLTGEYNKTAKKKLSENTIRAMLERLDEIGYVDTEQDDLDKRKHVYVPLKKGNEEDDKLVLNPSKITFGTDLEATLKKGFDLWLATITKEDVFYLDRNDSEATIGRESLEDYVLSKIQVKDIISKQDETVIVDNEDSKPKPESNPTNIPKLETEAFPTNSEGVMQ